VFCVLFATHQNSPYKRILEFFDILKKNSREKHESNVARF
jgi:hypothetical protein